MTQPYHPYVFRDGRFVGEFEAMYRDGESRKFDAWQQDDLRDHPVLSALGGARVESVLDLGCGKGALTNAIEEVTGATTVRAVDCSPTAVRSARERYPRINFQVANIQRAVRRWGQQDLVVASEVLSYLEGWRAVVADMMAIGRMVCIGLFVPENPMGFVPSHQALVAHIESCGGHITKTVDCGHDRLVYLART